MAQVFPSARDAGAVAVAVAGAPQDSAVSRLGAERGRVRRMDGPGAARRPIAAMATPQLQSQPLEVAAKPWGVAEDGNTQTPGNVALFRGRQSNGEGMTNGNGNIVGGGGSGGGSNGDASSRPHRMNRFLSRRDKIMTTSATMRAASAAIAKSLSTNHIDYANENKLDDDDDDDDDDDHDHDHDHGKDCGQRQGQGPGPGHGRGHGRGHRQGPHAKDGGTDHMYHVGKGTMTGAGATTTQFEIRLVGTHDDAERLVGTLMNVAREIESERLKRLGRQKRGRSCDVTRGDRRASANGSGDGEARTRSRSRERSVSTATRRGWSAEARRRGGIRSLSPTSRMVARRAYDMAGGGGADGSAGNGNGADGDQHVGRARGHGRTKQGEDSEEKKDEENSPLGARRSGTDSARSHRLCPRGRSRDRVRAEGNVGARGRSLSPTAVRPPNIVVVLQDVDKEDLSAPSHRLSSSPTSPQRRQHQQQNPNQHQPHQHQHQHQRAHGHRAGSHGKSNHGSRDPSDDYDKWSSWSPSSSSQLCAHLENPPPIREISFVPRNDGRPTSRTRHSTFAHPQTAPPTSDSAAAPPPPLTPRSRSLTMMRTRANNAANGAEEDEQRTRRRGQSDRALTTVAESATNSWSTSTLTMSAAAAAAAAAPPHRRSARGAVGIKMRGKSTPPPSVAASSSSSSTSSSMASPSAPPQSPRSPRLSSPRALVKPTVGVAGKKMEGGATMHIDERKGAAVIASEFMAGATTLSTRAVPTTATATKKAEKKTSQSSTNKKDVVSRGRAGWMRDRTPESVPAERLSPRSDGRPTMAMTEQADADVYARPSTLTSLHKRRGRSASPCSSHSSSYASRSSSSPRAPSSPRLSPNALTNAPAATTLATERPMTKTTTATKITTDSPKSFISGSTGRGRGRSRERSAKAQEKTHGSQPSKATPDGKTSGSCPSSSATSTSTEKFHGSWPSGSAATAVDDKVHGIWPVGNSESWGFRGRRGRSAPPAPPSSRERSSSGPRAACPSPRVLTRKELSVIKSPSVAYLFPGGGGVGVGSGSASDGSSGRVPSIKKTKVDPAVAATHDKAAGPVLEHVCEHGNATSTLAATTTAAVAAAVPASPLSPPCSGSKLRGILKNKTAPAEGGADDDNVAGGGGGGKDGFSFFVGGQKRNAVRRPIILRRRVVRPVSTVATTTTETAPSGVVSSSPSSPSSSFWAMNAGFASTAGRLVSSSAETPAGTGLVSDRGVAGVATKSEGNLSDKDCGDGGNNDNNDNNGKYNENGNDGDKVENEHGSAFQLMPRAA